MSTTTSISPRTENAEFVTSIGDEDSEFSVVKINSPDLNVSSEEEFNDVFKEVQKEESEFPPELFPNPAGSDVEVNFQNGNKTELSVSLTGLEGLDKTTVNIPIKKDGSVDLTQMWDEESILKLFYKVPGSSRESEDNLVKLIRNNIRVIEINPEKGQTFISIPQEKIPKKLEDNIVSYAENYIEDENGNMQKHLVIPNKSSLKDLGEVIERPTKVLVPKLKKETKENPEKKLRKEQKASEFTINYFKELLGENNFKLIEKVFKAGGGLEKNEFYKLDELESVNFGEVRELKNKKTKKLPADALAVWKSLQYIEASKAIMKEEGIFSDIQGGKLISAYARFLDVIYAIYDQKEGTEPPVALIDNIRTYVERLGEIHKFDHPYLEIIFSGAAGEYASMSIANSSLEEFNEENGTNLRVVYSSSYKDISAKADYYVKDEDIEIPVQAKGISGNRIFTKHVYMVINESERSSIQEVNSLDDGEKVYSTSDISELMSDISVITRTSDRNLNKIKSSLVPYKKNTIHGKYIMLSLIPSRELNPVTGKIKDENTQKAITKEFKEQIFKTMFV